MTRDVGFTICFGALCLLVGIRLLAEPAVAQPLDQGALVRDLTITRQAGGRLTVSMWMPEVFWQASLRNGGGLTEGGIERYLAVLRPYVLIAVLDAQRGITAFQYTQSDVLTAETTIEDSHGTLYKPLSPDATSEEIRNLIQMMRPLLTNMMGAMGQHMEFLVFANADAAGNPIADPKRPGTLTVHIADISMGYRLPLGSVLPPAVDPRTGESFPGNYRYSPYTGDKLIPLPAAGGAPAHRGTP